MGDFCCLWNCMCCRRYRYLFNFVLQCSHQLKKYIFDEMDFPQFCHFGFWCCNPPLNKSCLLLCLHRIFHFYQNDLCLRLKCSINWFQLSCETCNYFNLCGRATHCSAVTSTCLARYCNDSYQVYIINLLFAISN